MGKETYHAVSPYLEQRCSELKAVNATLRQQKADLRAALKGLVEASGEIYVADAGNEWADAMQVARGALKLTNDERLAAIREHFADLSPEQFERNMREAGTKGETDPAAAVWLLEQMEKRGWCWSIYAVYPDTRIPINMWKKGHRYDSEISASNRPFSRAVSEAVLAALRAEREVSNG